MSEGKKILVNKDRYKEPVVPLKKESTKTVESDEPGNLGVAYVRGNLFSQKKETIGVHSSVTDPSKGPIDFSVKESVELAEVARKSGGDPAELGVGLAEGVALVGRIDVIPRAMDVRAYSLKRGFVVALFIFNTPFAKAFIEKGQIGVTFNSNVFVAKASISVGITDSGSFFWRGTACYRDIPDSWEWKCVHGERNMLI